LNDLESEIDFLLSWNEIKRKYLSGLVLTGTGIFVFIVKLILLQNFFPNYIVYHQSVIVYNGTLIRLYVGVTMGGLGGLLLLIGLPLLIIYSKKRNKL
jgi:hypothetical protein